MSESLNSDWGVVKIRPYATETRSLNSALEQIRAMPGVIDAEPNWRYQAVETTADPFSGEQWGVSKIGATQVWSTITGLGIVVAIIDSGVDTGHPEFMGRLVAGNNFSGGNSADVMDRNGHGTHVAGVVAANLGNGQGGSGVAPGAMIMPVKVLGDNGSGTTDTVLSGVRFAMNNGAKVINMSLGGPQSSSLMTDAIREAWNRGVVVVAAAGNNGNTTMSYPGAIDEVICVGASDTSDQRASFSNYGSWVDVAAPGTNIFSTTPNNQYTRMQGTSMATPFVSAQAALIFQSLGLGATAQQVRTRIESTALSIGTWVSKGRIRVPESLAVVSTPTVTSTEHFPSLVKVTRGSAGAGTLEKLRTSDNQYMVLRSTPLGRNEAAASSSTISLSPRVPNSAGTVTLTIELSANTAMFASLQVWEPGAKRWRTLRSLRLGTSDATYTLVLEKVSTMLSNGTMQLGLTTSLTTKPHFEIRLDQLKVQSVDGNVAP